MLILLCSEGYRYKRQTDIPETWHTIDGVKMASKRKSCGRKSMGEEEEEKEEEKLWFGISIQV